MNVLNRALILIMALLLIVLLIVGTIVPYTVLDRLARTVQQAQDALMAGWPMSYIVFLVIAIFAILVLLVLLWLEVRPHGKKVVNVRSVGGTQAELSTDSVRQSLEYRIGQLADVLRVKPTVSGKRGGVSVLLDLETIPELDIPAKMEEVTVAARELIEGKMGLKLSSIRVRIKQAAYGRTKPTPAPTPLPAPVESKPTSGNTGEAPTVLPPTSDAAKS